MKKTLKEIFIKHKGKLSDKWTFYLDEWDRLFEMYQDQQIHLLEIGIQNGGSLEVWAKYFSKAEKIIGCDIDEKCRELIFDDDRISVVVCDANSDDCAIEILHQSPTFDIIIDDGSHKSSDIVRSFARYFPHLNDGGIYVIEDLHSSYWKNFEGGLHNPLSVMAFIKRLADLVNYEHWRNNKPRNSILANFTDELGIEFYDVDLIRIHSIELLNSLCIIKKMPPGENVLGKRIIVGKDQFVTKGFEQLNNLAIQDLSMEITDDGNLEIFNIIDQNINFSKQATELEQTIQTLTAQSTEQDHATQKLIATITERDEQVRSLTAQALEQDHTIQGLITTVAEQNDQVQSLNAQTVEREQENLTLHKRLAQSQEEVLFYAMSRSWKLTRPLRKIKQLLKRKNA